MAYIGNAKTPLLLASNVRDDLIPGDIVNDICTKREYNLSQEVPGGEEQNVTVVRRKFITDVLISNSLLISTSVVTIENRERTVITITDNYLASALSVVQPKSSNYEGDKIKISFDSTVRSATVYSATYTRDQIQIVLEKNLQILSFSEGQKSITLHRQYYAGWEILDPQLGDYQISGTFGTDQYNKKIILKDAPQVDDVVYVLHKGDATYNFVPSPNSVGVDQLGANLKNFKCDRFEGNGTQSIFSLTQPTINERALLITVDGLVKEGEDLTTNPVTEGDWKLLADAERIEFDAPPPLGAKIRVLHLGFVAGLRRALFAPGQQPNEIGSRVIVEDNFADTCISTRTIRDSAITNSKLQNDAVSSQKILLSAIQNDGVRIQYSDGVKNLVGVENDSTQIYTKTDFSIKRLNETILRVDNTQVSPGLPNIALGTPADKFSSLNVSGGASVGGIVVTTNGAAITGTTNIAGATNISGNTTISGNLSVTGGNISVTGTVDGVDVSDLRDAVVALQAKVSTLIPVGTIMASGRGTAHTQDGVWLLCDGAELDVTEYQDLFNAIQYTFGGSGTKFNLPDLRRRVSVGKSASDTLGANEGSTVTNRLLTHNHTGAAHKHNLSAHTHSVPGHKHLITSGSTLRIESTTAKPSGGHTTNISHNHAETTTSVPYNTTNTATNNLTHTHTYTHSHTGQNTDPGGVDHIHSASASTDYPDHAHWFGDIGIRNMYDSGDGINVYYQPSNSDPSIGTSGATARHTHTIYVSSALNPGANPYGNGFTHIHTFSTASHTGRTGGADVADNSLSHIHRYTTPAFTGTSSNPAGGTDGAHGHAADTFLGSIGNDSAIDGNSTMSSGVPSTDSTGDVDYTGYSGKTGDATTPHLILNFIIKAKNS